MKLLGDEYISIPGDIFDPTDDLEEIGDCFARLVTVWKFGGDVDPVVAIKSRKRKIDPAARDMSRMLEFRFLNPSVEYAEYAGTVYRFVPSLGYPDRKDHAVISSSTGQSSTIKTRRSSRPGCHQPRVAHRGYRDRI